jgi:signal transduction histidine kinase
VNREEAGALQPASEPVDPGPLVRAAIGKVTELAIAAGVTLEEDLPASLPAITGDAARLERVLVNLVSNAIDHTPREGQVRISAEAVSGDDVVAFSVTDTGGGIPPEEQERVFEKFHQAGDDNKREAQRSGLGLSFCKTVVEAHGGCIRVASNPGQGTRICFTIPCGRH